MSRDTILDDAISKAKEAEDWQLVEWLRMARGGESAARWYTQKVNHLEAENKKLRELVRDAWGDGHPDRSCEGCDIRDECHEDTEMLRNDGIQRFSRCLFELRIEDRMRDLGIEVGR